MVSQASVLFPSGVLQFPGAEVYTLPLIGGRRKGQKVHSSEMSWFESGTSRGEN